MFYWDMFCSVLLFHLFMGRLVVLMVERVQIWCPGSDRDVMWFCV